LLFLEERAGPFEGQGLPGLLPPPPRYPSPFPSQMHSLPLLDKCLLDIGGGAFHH
jgi:hypothetical protein